MKTYISSLLKGSYFEIRLLSYYFHKDTSSNIFCYFKIYYKRWCLDLKVQAATLLITEWVRDRKVTKLYQN